MTTPLTVAPLIGTLKDSLRKLLERRATLVAERDARTHEIGQIDQELADVGIKPPSAIAPVKMADAPRRDETPRQVKRHRDLTQCRADVKAALGEESVSGSTLLRELNWPNHLVNSAIRQLLEDGAIISIGTKGRGRRLALPPAPVAAPPARRTAPPCDLAGAGEELVPIWPSRADPKASPASVLTEGRLRANA